ncbi:MAG: 30S ribosome-binding factor RbfA [Bacteroidales bacterium]|nr:30S ribosome-binding factor RbfA [Bacteroidales bacterium]
METTRQNKISRLIQKDLGEIFRFESINLFKGAMITVTKVLVSPDLSIAKVYLSLFATNDKDELLIKIKRQAKSIRYDLGKKIRNQIRVIPELHFFIDDSLDYIDNIDKLLEEDE